MRPSGRTQFWGYMRATLKQTFIRSMKELVERGTVEAKWCPAKWCNAYGSHKSCVQPIETIRISLPYVQTKATPTVLSWVTLNFWVAEVFCKVSVLRDTSQLVQMVSGG